jgi:hypothetical protein
VLTEEKVFVMDSWCWLNVVTTCNVNIQSFSILICQTEKDVALAEEKVFIAVPAEPRAGKSTLPWALDHLYVRCPSSHMRIFWRR